VSGRVLLVHPAAGGVATVAERGAEALRARGWSVEALPVPRAGGSALPVALRTAWRARGAWRRADVVHVELGRLDAEVFWVAALLALPARVVLVAHDAPDPVIKGAGARAVAGPASRRWRSRLAYRVAGPLLDRLLRRLVVRRARVAVVLTEAARDGWRTPRAVVVAPHGADGPTPDRRPPSTGSHVLFAGFLGPSKGLDVLLDAWRAVGGASGLPLLVAGEPAAGDDAAWVAGLRRRPTPGVTWLGAVADERWARLFADAAIVVLPYRASNPASGILVRAMVEGRPVVATPVPAVAAVGDPSALVVVPAEDPAALATALRTLLADPAARDALGARAAAAAARRWTWDRTAEALEGAYARAAGRPVSGRR
jgi:glycosyltransferase involved in cell wall biosynthesis